MKQAIVLATNMSRDFNSKTSLLTQDLLGFSVLDLLVDQVREAGAERIIIYGPIADEKLKNALDLVDMDLVYREATGDLINFNPDDFEDSDDILVISEFCPFLEGEDLRIFFDESIKEGHRAAVLCGKDLKIDNGVYYFKASNLVGKDFNFFSSSEVKETLDKFNIDLVHRELVDESGVMMVRTRRNLFWAQDLMKDLALDRLFDMGVTILDPNSTIIGPRVQIGMDTVIYPGVRILGESIIGSSCIIEGDTSIRDSEIGDNCHIRSAYITDSIVYDNVTIGPYAQLRPKSIVRSGAHIGNFVELKKTDFGEGAKAGHLAYLGDSQVGKDVNIGCGVITVNYDGKNKHQTIIEDGAFVGSNSNLIAPVKVEKNAFVAAGSTITKDVEADALAIERTEQVNVKDWVKRKKER